MRLIKRHLKTRSYPARVALPDGVTRTRGGKFCVPALTGDNEWVSEEYARALPADACPAKAARMLRALSRYYKRFDTLDEALEALAVARAAPPATDAM